MIASCKRENLLRGLSIVGRMVRQRATLPVLSNIMISTDKGRLKLSATDLEAAVTTWIGAKIDEEGAITVPARTIIDYVSASSDETILITVKETDIGLTSEHNKTTIKGLEANEFPQIPKIKESGALILKAPDLKRAILSTSFAAALDETRPVLAGILLKTKTDKLHLVATDSYRLAEYVLDCGKVPKPFEIIIPSRTANELSRILPSNDVEVAISIGESQVEFSFDDVEFSTRQIEGSFPDYDQIIPKEFSAEIEATGSEFAEAIKTANVFARDVGGNIKISVGTDKAVINAVASQTGDTQASFGVSFKGTPMVVAFNAKYILDVLTLLEGDRIVFGLTGELNPGLICDKVNPSFKYVVMPLRSE